jgi:hypothetical protein
MNKHLQAQMFREFLESEGYDSEIDDDGDVIFRQGGRTYLILIDEDDEEFFRLVFPNFWSIDSEEERERVEKAALYATAKTKVAKVFPVRNNVWATIEMFISPIEGFKPVFDRSMRALHVAVHSFAEKMREEEDNQPWR